MKRIWMAVHDGRTRDSHAMVDGEMREIGEPFSNGLRYPGDPQGAPEEIYNCRCRTKAAVEGSDAYENGYDPSLRPSQYLKDAGLTYEQWKDMHRKRYYSKMSKKEK